MAQGRHKTGHFVLQLTVQVDWRPVSGPRPSPCPFWLRWRLCRGAACVL